MSTKVWNVDNLLNDPDISWNIQLFQNIVMFKTDYKSQIQPRLDGHINIFKSYTVSAYHNWVP